MKEQSCCLCVTLQRRLMLLDEQCVSDMDKEDVAALTGFLYELNTAALLVM